MHISNLVLDDENDDDDNHGGALSEQVPLTPRDSSTSGSSNSSSISSLQSHRSGTQSSYLQYFRSPPFQNTTATATTSNTQTALRSVHSGGSAARSGGRSRSALKDKTTSVSTPLFSVAEQSDFELNSYSQQHAYTVPDSYQVGKERARRESFHSAASVSTPGSASSASTSVRSSMESSSASSFGRAMESTAPPSSQSQSYGAAAIAADLRAQEQENSNSNNGRRRLSRDNHNHQDDDDSRSIRSSVSHLFGEELVLDESTHNHMSVHFADDDDGNNNNNDTYHPRDTDQGVMSAGDVEQGSSSRLSVSSSSTSASSTSSQSRPTGWWREVSDSVLYHVHHEWHGVRNTFLSFRGHHGHQHHPTGHHNGGHHGPAGSARVGRRGEALPLSPRSRNLADLDYLTAQHKNKVQQIRMDSSDNFLDQKNAPPMEDEFYDFCLVLQPQEVYAFWSTLLDFREEMLGPEVAQAISANLFVRNGEGLTSVANDNGEKIDTGSPTLSTDRTLSVASGSADETDEESEARDYLPAEITNTTPSTGIHRRRTARSTNNKSSIGFEMAPETTTPQIMSTPRTGRSRQIQASPGLSVTDSSRASVRTRVSIFEREMGMTNSSAVGMTILRRQSLSSRSLLDDPTPSGLRTATESSGATPSTVTSSRRRWGNHQANTHVGSVTSSPMRSMTQGPVMLPRRPTTAARIPAHVLSSSSENGQQQETSHSHSIRMEDIPNHVLPRGIAARTNGMLQFLFHLKGGIVMRRHRPGQEAVFCRISSKDGGDTIQYETVEPHDAMNAFKEQRVRCNKTAATTSDGLAAAPTYTAQSWSLSEDASDSSNNTSSNNIDSNDENAPNAHNFSIPDHVAAKQYREKMIRDQKLSKTVRDIVSKVVSSGTAKAADIVSVHPALHPDPRSDNSETGTSSLRRSKSSYAEKFSFSLVMRSTQRLARGNTASIDEHENKWYKKEGSETQFTYLDLEAATEGEYWLIFRGFLLLHRDAVVGRFAEQRAAGIGSNYNRLELEQRGQAGLDDYNVLHKDEFHEPVTVGCLERLVVKLRDLDTTYMEGFTLPQAKAPPSDYFLGFRGPGTQIWSRLRQAGFETQRVYSLDPRRVMIKVRCPSDRLMDVAEVLRLKLKTRDGSFAPFREDMLDVFQPLDDPLECAPIHDKNDFLFRSSIRQSIIDFIIGSRYRDSGAELGNGLGNMVQARIPLHMHGKLNTIYTAWVCFWQKENWRDRDGRSMTASTEFADLDMDDGTVDSKDKKMPGRFKRFCKGSFHQPLDSIEQYFGEKIAFYFAWVQHTATYLVFLSIVGVFVFLLQVGTGHWDHPIRPYFAMVVMLWTFVVIVNWRKRANFLAYRWGTMNYKEQETTRPQFQGEDHFDEITREWILVYPKWKRWVKYAISFPLTLLFTCGSLIMILWVHANRDLQLARYLDQKTNPGSDKFQFDFAISAIGKKAPIVVELSREHFIDPTFWFITVGMPAMLGLCLPLLNFILMKLSVWLNDFENYRTESEYRSYLIIKVFSFRFMCYFATLYYYAFLSVGSDEAIENGIFRVGTSVFVYTTVAHWWQLAVHVYFPIVIRKMRMNHRHKRLGSELRDIELEEEEIARLAANAADEDRQRLHMAGNESDPKEEDISRLAGADLKKRQAADDLKKRHLRTINKRLLLEQAQDGIWLEIMLPQHDSFPEYISAVVQFTFVTCFSVVFPLTPLICLFNYLLSMRLDAYKLCKGRRRPLSEQTGGIGIWEHLLHIVAVISVLTNCWLMGFTTSQFRGIGDAIGEIGLFAIVVGWEHIMLLIKYVMDTTVSPLPTSVRDDMKREQYQVDLQRNSVLQDRRTQHQRELGSTGDSYRDKDHHDANMPEAAASPDRHVHGMRTIPFKERESDVRTPLVGLQTIPSHDDDDSVESNDSPPPIPASLTPPLHPNTERRLYSA